MARERIVPKIVASGIGTVSENDIKSAIASGNANIMSFHVKVDGSAEALAERSNISIFPFEIIYELSNKVETLLTEKEPKVEVEETSSTSKVLKTFSHNKDNQVLGARVLSGAIKRGMLVKVVRRDTEIGRGKVKELQQGKVVVDHIDEGNEFGAMIDSKIEIVPGDVISTFATVVK